jgi:hypothetical protein
MVSSEHLPCVAPRAAGLSSAAGRRRDLGHRRDQRGGGVGKNSSVVMVPVTAMSKASAAELSNVNTSVRTEIINNQLGC